MLINPVEAQHRNRDNPVTQLHRVTRMSVGQNKRLDEYARTRGENGSFAIGAAGHKSTQIPNEP
jgi:hypothetical protein